ncbi:hypothetical protein OS493_027249 [Desmophyllum pertusum]|uniref:Tyr recombinase domain-containing protein n=1 Tax=Desmophyllum pertusum TaxID=174260 RepID=A0A9W9Z9T4_9CNID|nr:hypothetical protein OS493_027249 [Desmophyllum pertusum]
MQWCDWEGNPLAGPDRCLLLIWCPKGLAFASLSMLRFPAPRVLSLQICLPACPTTLAAGSVDSIIGKLRSLFMIWVVEVNGTTSSVLGILLHTLVLSIILSHSERKQAQARVTPKQATPFFFDKLAQLCTFLRGRVFADKVLSMQRYLYTRDLAFFVNSFSRGIELRISVGFLPRKFWPYPTTRVYSSTNTFGKTLRGMDTNSFMVKRCHNPTICPVSNLRLYVDHCDLMSVNVRDGHLFRSTDRKGAVSDKPFVGSAVANRLTPHLRTLGIHEGETVHSFRSGCSITMSMVGVSLEDVARHVGWKSLNTAEYYTQTGRVLNMSRAASARTLTSMNTLRVDAMISISPKYLRTGRMNVRMRSKARKQNEMSATGTDKLDCVLAKMDQQERKLNSILQKLESLESSQKQTAQDVKDLKDGYGYLEKQVDEVKSDIAEKASRAEIATLERKN